MKKCLLFFFLVCFQVGISNAVLAVDFYNINSPEAGKVSIYISAEQNTTFNGELIQNLQFVLDSSLLFKVEKEKEEADISILVHKSVESKEIYFTLASLLDKSVTPKAFGVRFRSTDSGYLMKKSAQIGNRILKELFNSSGSLGSTLTWSTQVETRKTLYIGKFAMQDNRQLSYNYFTNYGVSWSPKEDQIIYVSQTSLGTRIYLQQIKPLRTKAISIYENDGKASSPYWAPDGTVYLSLYQGGSKADIVQFSLDGTPYQEENVKLSLIQKWTNSSFVDTEPKVSPSGEKMLFISDRTGSPQVYVKDLESLEVRRITRKGGKNTSASWSPDEKYIAYSSLRGGEERIYRIDLESGEEKAISPAGLKAESPVWSPDGSLIAFTGKKEKQASKIYYMLSTGGKYRRLTQSPSHFIESNPSWGKAILR